MELDILVSPQIKPRGIPPRDTYTCAEFLHLINIAVIQVFRVTGLDGLIFSEHRHFDIVPPFVTLEPRPTAWSKYFDLSK